MKINQWFTFTPYLDYAYQIEPAVSAWQCSTDWKDANELRASQLLTFYKNQYLRDLDGGLQRCEPLRGPGLRSC